MKNPFQKLIVFLTKNGLIVGSVIMFTVSSIIIWKTFQKKTITEKGISVYANIISSPDCENIGRRPDYATLEFNGRKFVKKAPNGICQLMTDRKSIQMLTNKEKDKLLFENEYEEMDFVYGGILLMISGVVFYKGINKK